MSLLELLAVVVLMGIFAGTVGMRFGRTLFAEFGAHAVAREIALALTCCQRAAITTGDDHSLEFLSSGGKISHYRLMRDLSGTPTLVDGPKAILNDVTVTSSHTSLQYTFEGHALSNYAVVVTGQNRVWRIDVIPVTGTQIVTQTN